MEVFPGKPGAGGEERQLAISMFRGVLCVVIYTLRDGGGRRYISFRPARKDERREYHGRKESIS